MTGGFAPNIEGWTKPLRRHAVRRAAPRASTVPITEAVHAEGGQIALQILHTGRYGYHPLVVAPSRDQEPRSPRSPRAP